MTTRRRRWAVALGTKVAPARFLLFAVLMVGVAIIWQVAHAAPAGDALVIGFDVGAVAFMVSLHSLLREHSAPTMRRRAAENDANRALVLLLTAATSLAILAAISSELPAAKQGQPLAIVKLVGTLALSWAFTNLIFMLHYAHMHYMPRPDGSGDLGGFDFPGTPQPDYWDFLYFAFTAGMSFAASDVNVTRGAVRRVVVWHCLLSFVFNIGVLAFSINVLAGAAG
ncbi:MAG: DUF1345 domain-containing protein [Sphingomonadales bacterium]|nr:DUF1345 domain-containing protein [Sphingomonadales bacterium]